MSDEPPWVPGTSGLLRVSVASHLRRADVVLPGTVAVAELIPELAREVGLLEGASASGGYCLLTGEGRVLAPEVDLIGQGIRDGGLLTVTAGVRATVPRAYDDVIEAVADVVQRDFRPWTAAAARRTSLVVASVLLVLGAGGLIPLRGTLAGGVATVVAAVLVAGALVMSRSGESVVAGGVLWIGATYAAAAGHLLVGGGVGAGACVIAAGVGALGAGATALLGFGVRRALTFPPIVGGLFLLATGLALRAPLLGPSEVFPAGLVLVVLVSAALPAWSVAVARSTAQHATSLIVPPGVPAPVDPARVAAETQAAHELRLTISATCGVIATVLAPLSARLGVAGTGLALCCSLILALRARPCRADSEVFVGIASGAGSAASAIVAAFWLQDGWRPFIVGGSLLAGVALLIWTLGGAPRSVRLSRLGDLMEAAALFTLAPLVVVATGAFDAVRR